MGVTEDQSETKHKTFSQEKGGGGGNKKEKKKKEEKD